jgi:hypothetical protein
VAPTVSYDFGYEPLATPVWGPVPLAGPGRLACGLPAPSRLRNANQDYTEFTSMLEGYENVRAYCYNCMLPVFTRTVMM